MRLSWIGVFGSYSLRKEDEKWSELYISCLNVKCLFNVKNIACMINKHEGGWLKIPLQTMFKNIFRGRASGLPFPLGGGGGPPPNPTECNPHPPN